MAYNQVQGPDAAKRTPIELERDYAWNGARGKNRETPRRGGRPRCGGSEREDDEDA
jgi:hypothetical protein